ncbi:MAG: hypothetical protein P1V20_03505 [Verrucomicrobiales bacterium]|nr:hypothetical protein [Verrucomicrobiales bacterium]
MNQHEDSAIKKLAAEYLVALRLHNEDDGDSHLETARKLGETAGELGLGTLKLAKMHVAALSDILSAPDSAAGEEAITAQATIFFNEALMQVEKTNRIALDAALELRKVKTDLNQATEDLATSRHAVKREIEDRELTESALLSRRDLADELLRESRHLEEKLREMTHRSLTANEAERQQMSLFLHNEIAQTLLGIHIKLLALKEAVSISHEDIAQQIATTQSIMAKSVETISHFADSLHGGSK